MRAGVESVKKTVVYVLTLSCIAAMLILFASMLPAASAAATFCPCADLDTCVEWVSEGSLSIQWGRTAVKEVNGIKYTFRADDFDDSMKAALISAEKEGIVKKEFLFLEGADDRKSFVWDDEIKVELSGISVDGQKTPSAQIKLYSRGRPKLEIGFAASSETVDGVSVSAKQYAPGEEKKIEVTVKNTGDAWAENVVLMVDLVDFSLKGKGDFQFRDQIIKKELGCLEKGDTAAINFTVIAPQWDGRTSPYELVYSINATAGGYDIKKGYHDTSAYTSFECTEPDMKVILEVINDDINMTSWYVRHLQSGSKTYSSKDYEIRDAWEYSLLRTHIFNTGLYTISDLNITFSPVADEFVISETYESGSHASMDPDGQYYLGQKLVPMRQGTYSFASVVVTANFFGKELSWKSGTSGIKVHGPYIVLAKTLSASEDARSVTLKVSNTGDRAAWVNLTDTIPAAAGYVDGSIEESLKGGDLPLSEWDHSISQYNGSHVVSVKGVLLPPGTDLSFSYDISSSSAPDLPPAVCSFRGIGDYKGQAQSSFYVAGREVKQYWDPFNGGWLPETQGTSDDAPATPAEPLPSSEDEEEEEYDEEELYAMYERPSEISMEVQQEPAKELSFLERTKSIGKGFDKIQRVVTDPFEGMLEGIFALFSLIENAAINAVEKYLYLIIVAIALTVFSLAYTLVYK